MNIDGQLQELGSASDTVLDIETKAQVFQAWCIDNETFNPLASLFWQTEGGIIRDILSESILCSITQMVVFAMVWYFFTIITYGVFVPAGLFLPGMIIGCAIGEIYAHSTYFLGIYDETHYQNYRVSYIIIGMAAMLASYTRMTYSLAVIVMETCQNMNIFMPIVITIGCANLTGSWFTRGLYDRAVRGKQMPILKGALPMANREFRAELIMSKKIVYL